VATLIEFSHRVTSGLALLLVVGLAVWAWRAYPRGHVLRKAAAASVVLMLTEALVGAGLVLLELVAHDASLRRAVALPTHLINTFFLLAALALTAWWSTVVPPDRTGPVVRLRGQGGAGAFVAASLFGVLLLGVSGAVTALGDTLFPSGSLAEGMRQDFSPTAHFLLRLRIWHPSLALLVGALVAVTAGVAWLTRDGQRVQRFALLVLSLFLAQLVAGVANLLLLVPVWMQLVHLLLADLLWISLVLLAAAVVAVPAAEEGGDVVAAPSRRGTDGRPEEVLAIGR
jgi:heme A synthase